jgi:hypothetical protein
VQTQKNKQKLERVAKAKIYTPKKKCLSLEKVERQQQAQHQQPVEHQRVEHAKVGAVLGVMVDAVSDAKVAVVVLGVEIGKDVVRVVQAVLAADVALVEKRAGSL